jgi:hypothetical protein
MVLECRTNIIKREVQPRQRVKSDGLSNTYILNFNLSLFLFKGKITEIGKMEQNVEWASVAFRSPDASHERFNLHKTLSHHHL